MPLPTGIVWEGTNVDMTTIERELADAWGQLSQQELHCQAVRTSIYNLVVFTRSNAEARRVSETLERLGGRRPSRAIILVADRLSPLSSLDASVHVGCYDHSINGMPLCGEQIQIVAHGRSADHLASVAIPLLLPELPTYLWWPGQPPFGHRFFHRLLAVCDQLVVDSSQFSSPGDGLADLARLCSGRQGVNDLQWARLRPWREIIAQFFDGHQWRPYAEGIRSIRVEFGAGRDYTVTASGTLLLLAWAGIHLGWTPETTLDYVPTSDVSMAVFQGERTIPIDLQYRDHRKTAAGKLMAIELVAQTGGLEPARFSVARTDDLNHSRSTMQIHGGPEVSRIVPLPVRSDEEVLVDELEQAGKDIEYHQVVDLASRLAGREVWVPA